MGKLTVAASYELPKEPKDPLESNGFGSKYYNQDTETIENVRCS